MCRAVIYEAYIQRVKCTHTIQFFFLSLCSKKTLYFSAVVLAIVVAAAAEFFFLFISFLFTSICCCLLVHSIYVTNVFSNWLLINIILCRYLIVFIISNIFLYLTHTHTFINIYFSVFRQLVFRQREFEYVNCYEYACLGLNFKIQFLLNDRTKLKIQ